MGKSAIMHAAPTCAAEETFTVCDLFDSEAPDEANEREMRGSYSTLTRRAFEANYLSFHDELPRVLQAPTTVVPDEVAAGSCRFVHVDASHLYEHVHGRHRRRARRRSAPTGSSSWTTTAPRTPPASRAPPGRRCWRAGCGRCASAATSSTAPGATPRPCRTSCTRSCGSAATAGCSGRRWPGSGCCWWARARRTPPAAARLQA